MVFPKAFTSANCLGNYCSLGYSNIWYNFIYIKILILETLTVYEPRTFTFGSFVFEKLLFLKTQIYIYIMANMKTIKSQNTTFLLFCWDLAGLVRWLLNIKWTGWDIGNHIKQYQCYLPQEVHKLSFAI